MNYRIIETRSIEEMQRQVREALADGWMLYGALIVYREYPNASSVTYYREMVK